MSDLTAIPAGPQPSPENECLREPVTAPRPPAPDPDSVPSEKNPAPRLPAFLKPYSRITSSGAFIPEIDGLRFIAIFSVYIYHLAGDIIRHSPPGQFNAHGGTGLFAVTQVLNVGVPLFFVISGFILGLPFALAHLGSGRPVSLRKYFLRRVTRLEPPYILSLLLFFVLKVATARGAPAELFTNLVASLLYVHNVVYRAPSVINFVAWSLEIEVQFYILAPLLALAFVIRQTWMRRALLGGMLLVATALSSKCSSEPVLGLSLLAFSQYFLAGFLLVEFYLAAGRKRRPHWLWDLVWFAGWASFLALLVQGGPAFGWFAPWLILLLYIAAFRGIVAQRIITNAWLTTIGGMCYTIYLLHNYLVAGIGMVTERILPGLPFETRLLVQFLLISPGVLIVSALYFRWIERPCMRPDWPQRLMAACTQLKVRLFFTPPISGSVKAESDE